MATTLPRLSDEAAHHAAITHAMAVLDLAGEPSVSWDTEHHLQGHLEVCGHRLVLIAPRTPDHAPLLVEEADWDAIRHGVAA